MIRPLVPLAFALLLAAPASAVTFDFACITGNGATSCAAGETQLSLDVVDLGGGQVSFTISNAGPISSSVANLYIQDDGGVLLSVVSVTDTSTVSFDPGGSPPVLPGGQTVGFIVDALWSAQNPKPQFGVNPGESLTVVYDVGSLSFADLLQRIADEELRFGLHVIAIRSGCGEALRALASDDGGDDFPPDDDVGDCKDDFSESFVNLPEPRDVPEPSLGLLLGLAALAAGAAGLRRR